jgi:Iron-containing redox enzyme
MIRATNWPTDPGRGFGSRRLGKQPGVKPNLPTPRGPLTEQLCSRLLNRPGGMAEWLAPIGDPLGEEDLQLALHICYGLHYDGFDAVPDEWEWDPSLLALRSRLEDRFLLDMVSEAADHGPGSDGSGQGQGTVARVHTMLHRATGPSLSKYMEERGTEEELREFVIHRSVYQRKEADAHTWAIPRLRGRAKSAIVTLQVDEYGNGITGRAHADLFATTMATLDLDPTPGAYIDQVPGLTLATDNLVSLFGLHRRWRGALVGHLSAFEMTSVLPMSRYATAIRRLIDEEAGAEFYDVHVAADVRHAKIAAEELVVGLAESDPEAMRDLEFGVAALLQVERRFSDHLLGSWASGISSLSTAPVEWCVGHPVPDELSFLRVLCLDEIPEGTGVGVAVR